MDLFDETCELVPEAQQAAVRRLAADDVDLAERLAKLLKHDAAEVTILEQKPQAVLAQLQVETQLEAPPVLDPALLSAGTVIDAWEVVSPLGAGGVGLVYRVKHRVHGQVAALKFIRADDDNSLRRFEREFRAIARLRHPGCVRVYERGAAEVGPYFVMELVAGGDAMQLAGAAAHTLLPIFAGVAEALAYVHEAGMLHRDLKPANILLTDHDPPRPKLADFGLAQLPDASGVLTHHGVVGSLDFLAPEQVRGSEVGPKSDLFSLGCTLFMLWTGRSAFQGDNFERLVARRQGKAPRLHTVRDAPERLSELVHQLLRPDPEHRPASAAAVAAALRDLV